MKLRKSILSVAVWLLLCTQGFAASEINYQGGAALTGQTLYFTLKAGAGHPNVGSYWNGSAWATYTTTRTTWDVTMSEVGVTGDFNGSIPSGVVGPLVWRIYQDADDNGTPSHADDILLAEGIGTWDGKRFLTRTPTEAAAGLIISVVTSQSVVEVDTPTPPQSNAYTDCWAIVRDNTTPNVSLRRITGSQAGQGNTTTELTLESACGFTVGTDDTVEILPPSFGAADRTELLSAESAVDSEVAAIKAKTDSLTYTISGKVDSNPYYWRGGLIPAVNITGTPLVDLDAVEGDTNVDLLESTDFVTDLLLDTTLSSVNSQTSLVLTAGSSVNDTYNGSRVVLLDVSNNEYPWKVDAEDYVGSTRTLTIDAAPGFTVAAGDKVRIFATATSTELAEAAADAAADTGGPIEQAEVAPAHILQAKSRGDGTFNVVGRVRMMPGEEGQVWAVEFKGTQVALNHNLYGMEEPTFTGDEAANMTLVDYGVDDTQAKFKITLSDSATVDDTINVRLVVRPSSTETVIVIVPVTVGS